METLRYIIVIAVLVSGIDLSAQNNVGKDTTVSFRVDGVCELCKNRIEGAVKIKGVKLAEWNVETKMLMLSYNPGVFSISKAHKLLAAAGHDTYVEKAKDAVYEGLPECCHYRKIENVMHVVDSSINKSIGKDTIVNKNGDLPLASANSVKGIVLEEDKKGTFKPLSGASVIWLGTSLGTMTDSSGVFMIDLAANANRLVVSYAGYTADTMTVIHNRELKIVLASGKQLSEVKVVARQKSTYVSQLNPIRTQVMTDKELFKAACCNLSESFETNPSVDVSYNDAVTGSKQIQLLGLSGNYSQLTVENLPGPRGIATPLGLNSIAGPWVESIQLNKGVGSVANGFESIAGQINVELKKPEKAERVFANAYINDMAKTDLNLNLAQKVGKKWNTILLLHNDFLNNKSIDFNKDGFRDLPTGSQFSAINRWSYQNSEGLITQFGFKVLTDKRTGGEVSFDPRRDKFSTNKYGVGINTRRYEGFAKVGYIFPEKKYQSIGLQLSAFNHHQHSYFGQTPYEAEQDNFYVNLIYQSIIGTSSHKFRTGLSLLADRYEEDFKGISFDRVETIPGAFFEYTFTPAESINIVAGIRADHNSLFGWFTTPRLHIRYEPVKGTTIRFSGGRGQRTANIFAENMSVFLSSRHLSIQSPLIGKAYGFYPEVAWNKGFSIDQKFKLFNRDASMVFDYFRNDFKKQVIIDLEDASYVKFYNLAGRSFSNSFQIELNMEPVRKLEVRLAYRFFDVRASYDNVLLQKPFTAKNRAFTNLAYEIAGWKFDYTVNYNGTKRIPNTAGNPAEYQRNNTSPSYILMNAQLSKATGKKHLLEFYVGGENLTNFFQKDAIIAADQPFSNYFDASLIWGPVSGRLLYTGFRYKFK